MFTDKHIQEFKRIYEKQTGKEITDAEASQYANNFYDYVKLIYDLAEEDHHRKLKLNDNPKGFPLDGDYSCSICGMSAKSGNNWYDKYGIKCLTCQSAIDKKIIPATAASNKDSWYSFYDLEQSFFINRFGIRKLIKEGLLKPRIVPGSGGGTHCQLFFIKDHEDILPPKKLTDWPTVKVQKDGEDWYHSEPWFMHADAKELLKGYKILEYYGTLEEKHITKSFPQLSFQLSKGARSMMKVNHTEPKDMDKKD